MVWRVRSGERERSRLLFVVWGGGGVRDEVIDELRDAR